MAEQKLQHTPWPWDLTEGDPQTGSDSRLFKEGHPEFTIAHITCEARNKQQREEDLANGRLLKHAPLLLTALRRSIEALEWCHQWLTGDDAAKVAQDIRVAKRIFQQATGVKWED